MATKSGDNTANALRHFTGGFAVKLCYSDNSLEIADACRQLGIPHETSQPGVPQNNGIIERANGDVLAMSRTMLIHAGLPNHCWPFAARGACHHNNISSTDNRESDWFAAHGKGEFNDSTYPFGCGVWYLPSDTKAKPRGKAQSQVRPKWGGRASMGVLAGYVMSPTGMREFGIHQHFTSTE